MVGSFGKMKLKVGHWVRWETICCGVTLKKKGYIVIILEPGENFYEAVEDLKKIYRFNIIHNKEKIRDHLSYVVLSHEGEGVPKLYWPDAGSLRKVSKPKVFKINKSKKGIKPKGGGKKK